MKKKAINVAKKAAKIAGVTCVAAGAIAIVTSGAAITASVEGFQYVKNTVKKILDATVEAEVVSAETPPAAPEAAAEVLQEEPVVAQPQGE